MGVKGLKSDTIFEQSLFLTLFLKRQNFVTDGEGVGVKNVHHHPPPPSRTSHFQTYYCTKFAFLFTWKQLLKTRILQIDLSLMPNKDYKELHL